MREMSKTLRMRGRAGRAASAAAATALVVATCVGCGSGPKADAAAKDDPGAESFPAEALTTVGAGGGASNAVVVPAYSVNGTVDVKAGDAPSAVGVNPKTNKIYVLNYKSNNMTVIDGATNKTRTVKVGTGPIALSINQVTNKIYVANETSLNKKGEPDSNGTGYVTVIDGATNKTTQVAAELQPDAVAVNEQTNKIYVANQGSNSVTVIDGATNKTTNVALRKDTDTLEEGVLSPQNVAVNPITDKIYVTGPQSNTVGVIDGKTNTYAVVLTEGNTPAGAMFGQTPTAVTINKTTNTVYVTGFNSNDVTAIDGPTNKTTNVPLQDVQDPYTIGVNPVTNKVYVANQTSRSISVIDGATKAAFTISDLPGKPHDVAVNPITNKIYFPLFILYRGAQVGDDKEITGLIAELDGATNALTFMIAGITPYAVAVNPVTNKVYVANQDSDDVTVLTVPAPSGGKAQ
jgi:YVTN family beta-propeller protein